MIVANNPTKAARLFNEYAARLLSPPLIFIGSDHEGGHIFEINRKMYSFKSGEFAPLEGN
jgi:hypothetical protein